MAGNYSGNIDNLGAIERMGEKLTAALDPFDPAKKLIGKLPFYSTGARSFIRIGGKPVAVCTDFRWQVAYLATPINTIDTPHAWDIDIGQASISATLNQILDPTQGPEAQGLFSIMQSAVHQPYVELQVLDALGTSLFFSRGMFTQVNGTVARGQVSTISASFVGVVYQHYVTQNFKPYNSIAGGLSGLVGGLKNLVSNATGGLL
jgi:hypothetical protein